MAIDIELRVYGRFRDVAASQVNWFDGVATGDIDVVRCNAQNRAIFTVQAENDSTLITDVGMIGQP